MTKRFLCAGGGAVLFAERGTGDIVRHHGVGGLYPKSCQAIKIRKFSAEGRLNEDVLLSIMSEEKPNQVEQWKIPKNRLEKYFPSGTTQQKMEETIIKALELYRKREKSRER